MILTPVLMDTLGLMYCSFISLIAAFPTLSTVNDAFALFLDTITLYQCPSVYELLLNRGILRFYIIENVLPTNSTQKQQCVILFYTGSTFESF